MRSRAFLAAVLSLLLVGAQLEVVVHAIDHLRARVAQGQGDALSAPTPECHLCPLLASTPHADVPAADVPPPAAAPDAVVAWADAPRVALARRFQDSQAPPVVA